MLYALQTEGGEGVFVNSDSVQFALVEFQKPAKVWHSLTWRATTSYWQYIVPQDRHCTGVYAVQRNALQWELGEADRPPSFNSPARDLGFVNRQPAVPSLSIIHNIFHI